MQAVIVGTLAAAAAAPPYVEPDGSRFRLTLDQAWKGARQAPVSGKPAVWAATCAPGLQAARLTRTIDIPGPPSELDVRWSAVVQGAAESVQLRSFELRVNGTSLYRASGTGGGATLRTPELRRFRFGRNTLEVRAVKAPFSAARDIRAGCNRGDASVKLGLVSTVEGRFSADLNLGAAEPVRHLVGTGKRIIGIDLSVRNNGPSAALLGRFSARLAGVDPTFFALGGEPPFGPCTVEEEGLTTEASCPFTSFAPRGTGLVRLRFGWQPPTGAFGTRTVSISWRIAPAGGTDPALGDNERRVRYVFCGAEATDPGCDGAT